MLTGGGWSATCTTHTHTHRHAHSGVNFAFTLGRQSFSPWTTKCLVAVSSPYMFFSTPTLVFGYTYATATLLKKDSRVCGRWKRRCTRLEYWKKMWIKSCAFVTRTKKCETGTLLLQCCCCFGCCCWCHLHITQQQRPLLSVPACVCCAPVCLWELPISQELP